VTTGNLAGIDIWLEEARGGTLTLDTNVVSGEVDLATLADDTSTAAASAGGSASIVCPSRTGAGAFPSIMS